ncbi:potassium-transporting ATPase subunit KdpC [Klenkia taihuensis]|uniref:Potassium-transporting ATPase KdpC subunit n=1 Tax=Klenkia taihuensis TaxID=1225127 RepID=A0A1I1UP36_9ACTN|nr:potassium-transporting ATPase subunit KdpC [Klenkia taihuensis]GHE13955.1 potassium-transporting ATPase KdpC subunit [Klenkia taihuensis]SFD72464.1 K+-transporting ATPase ATPase C chain [Klenkia taihuensis]
MTRQLIAGLRAVLLATVVLGLAYPLLMTGFAQVAVPGRADGSLVTSADGTVVGSSLLGQGFVSADGSPLAQYFQSRPSAGDWDGAASGGSNLGPSSSELAEAVASRRAEVASFNGVPESQVPDDAVTTSASGLDPGISPAYAAIQVERVAAARGVSPADVEALVEQATHGRDLGFIGAPGVDVLDLNLALDRAFG